ncbi:uncharacterized protein V6R79_012995 [Siganus canaliculatus]
MIKEEEKEMDEKGRCSSLTLSSEQNGISLKNQMLAPSYQQRAAQSTFANVITPPGLIRELDANVGSQKGTIDFHVVKKVEPFVDVRSILLVRGQTSTGATLLRLLQLSCCYKISAQRQSHLFAGSGFEPAGCTSGFYAPGTCDHFWTDFTPGTEMHLNSRKVKE